MAGGGRMKRDVMRIERAVGQKQEQSSNKATMTKGSEWQFLLWLEFDCSCLGGCVSDRHCC